MRVQTNTQTHGETYRERESRAPTQGSKEGAALRKPLLLTTLCGTSAEYPENYSRPDPRAICAVERRLITSR